MILKTIHLVEKYKTKWSLHCGFKHIVINCWPSLKCFLLHLHLHHSLPSPHNLSPQLVSQLFPAPCLPPILLPSKCIIATANQVNFLKNSTELTINPLKILQWLFARKRLNLLACFKRAFKIWPQLLPASAKLQPPSPTSYRLKGHCFFPSTWNALRCPHGYLLRILHGTPQRHSS